MCGAVLSLFLSFMDSSHVRDVGDKQFCTQTMVCVPNGKLCMIINPKGKGASTCIFSSVGKSMVPPLIHNTLPSFYSMISNFTSESCYYEFTNEVYTNFELILNIG